MTIKKAPKTVEERRRSEKAGYQQGFSIAGAALLARPWLVPEPPESFEDFTLAAYIEGPEEYHWNDES